LTVRAWHFAAIVGGVAIGIVLLGTVARMLIETHPAARHGVVVAAVWAQSALLAWVAWLVVLRPVGARLAEFGLRPIAAADLRLSLWLAFGAMAIGLAAELAVFKITGVDPSREQIQSIGLQDAGLVSLSLFFIGAAVLAPIGEEAVFRGVLLPWLLRRIGVWPAIVVSAAVFSAAHLQVSAMPSLAIVGLALGWCAVRTSSLTGPIVLHAAYNTMAAAGHLLFG